MIIKRVSDGWNKYFYYCWSGKEGLKMKKGLNK
jgi:hypothetical protein